MGHAGFYIDCHRMTVPENILLQKSTEYKQNESNDQVDHNLELCSLKKAG